MSDLNAKIVADLKRELARAKSEANAVTESMGSEIMRLHGKIEQQRTRAEAAEQELRDYTAHVAQSKNEDRSKLAAIRAHLQGVDVAALAELVEMATRAPWKAVHNFAGQDWCVAEFGSDDDGRPWTVSTDSIRCSEMDRGGASEDAKAIASLRNAAEALLAAAREALEP